jgi:hypothetical protein
MNFAKNILLFVIFLNVGYSVQACLQRFSMPRNHQHPASIEMDPKDEPAKNAEIRIFIKPEEFDNQDSFSLTPIKEFEDNKKIVRVASSQNLRNEVSYYDGDAFANYFGKKDSLEDIHQSLILGKLDIQKRMPISSYALYKKNGTRLERRQEWPEPYDMRSPQFLISTSCALGACILSGSMVKTIVQKCLGLY